MMEIGVDSKEERLMFKRIFILYIQMAFLLPTTINKISPVHLATIFKMDGISERNWGGMQEEKTTPTVPPAPTKIHPDAEDAAALLMMARTASYVPKTDPGVPSFSLGLTDSSQEGASTQETEREKSSEAANLIEQLDSLVQRIASSATKGKNTSPQIQRETGGESSAKFETPRGLYQITDDMKQKRYIWGTRLKEDADGNTNEYEEMCTLIGQGKYILMRMHLTSLQAKSDIESQI
ncbi:uncharacterized protein LOC110271404 [Arachis ipaensis]|uniref:uncharacterized protein LOC110271404 n=1 Tax=Arachis ipaensis TaxID=130454 RepID=UPI000A2AF173|nr:uncharacterized protein LOC110271404 [Arachis ipaensis]